MTPGLRLDTGEFIPASELNQRIDMSEKTNPELMQWDRAGGHYMYTEYEMRQAIEPLQKRIAEQRTELIALTGDNERLQRRIAELEAQLEKGKQLCREQTATIVDRTKTVLDLEAQIASRQPLVTVEQIADLVRDHLTSVYVCTRVWNAWRVGTMTEDDFIPASEIEMADEIAEAVFALLPAPAQQPLASGQEPVAWQTFDGEGGYEFRQFAENETYHDDYIKRNGEKYSAWVTPLYTHPAPAQHPLSKSDAVDAARYRYCLQHGWPECRRQIHPTVEALHWGYEDGSQYPSPTAAIDDAAIAREQGGETMTPGPQDCALTPGNSFPPQN